MIYLIDDNLSRQKEAGWNETKFNEYSEIICVINNIDKLFIHKEAINKSATHIFIHESFKDLSALNNKSFINDFVKEINNKAINKEIFVVFFSGGKVERSIVDNIINIPADIFYDNLNVFLSKYSEKIIEIKHIVYGENIQIEEHIIELLKSKNNNIDDTLTIENSSKNLIFKSFEFEIEDPFEDTSSEIIYEEEDGYSDSLLSKLCIETLNTNEYENIFLPLCFGTSLSDFNGLRLATHIRCTFTKNQLKPIFIYSVVGLKDIFNNSYINILKTKNVFLIDYSKISIKNALDIEVNNFTIEELPKEIKKLNLQVPTNYEDNHSIANEWAIYRWAQVIGAYDDGINKITHLQKSNLYFKYLKTINPISDLNKLNFSQLKINYKDKPKVLYIDDEAEKGWYEIYCNILYEKNGIDFEYLDDEFNEKSREEIIDISLKKIIEKDIDLVILDFRLHKDDFENKNIEEVTGYKILKKIKEHNKGIQVIIFSATNKIWNLQELQKAGADGFIIKESPELSINVDFTNQSIKNIYEVIDECLEFSFLKSFYEKFNFLKQELEPRKNPKKHSNPLPKEFVGEYLKWLEFGIHNIQKYKSNEGNILSFSLFFSVLENISNRIIDVDNPQRIGADEYNFKFRVNNSYLNEFKSNAGLYSNSNITLVSKRNLNWNQKVLNTLEALSSNLTDMNILIQKRNDIIHSNSTTGNVATISKDELKKLFKIITENIENIS